MLVQHALFAKIKYYSWENIANLCLVQIMLVPKTEAASHLWCIACIPMYMMMYAQCHMHVHTYVLIQNAWNYFWGEHWISTYHQRYLLSGLTCVCWRDVPLLDVPIYTSTGTAKVYSVHLQLLWLGSWSMCMHADSAAKKTGRHTASEIRTQTGTQTISFFSSFNIHGTTDILSRNKLLYEVPLLLRQLPKARVNGIENVL